MALLALLAVAVMVFAYVLTSRLNAASRFVGVDRDRNAIVMAQAKRALVGWMAINAAGTDDSPGRLPCPEAPGDFNTANEGRAAGNCVLPAVGRLPWRTLGLEKLVDTAGEPLWYVVSPGWAIASGVPPVKPVINSDSPGQITLDGNAAIALIIAPGPAIRDGCSGFVQTRPAAAPPNLANYLECGNATANYVTASPGNSFNDQVLHVTAADVMPALEAAIADRMQREIAPALRTVYTSAQYSGIPGSSPMYPYAAPFSNPATSSYQGGAGMYQGLLPFNQTQGCNPATDPRCTTTLVAWSSAAVPVAARVGGVGIVKTETCSWQFSGSVAVCEGEYEEDNANPSGAGLLWEMTATINNVAMGVRKLDWSKAVLLARNGTSDPWIQIAPEFALATMNANGSVTITFRSRTPNVDAMGWGHKALYNISLDRAVIGDHALLDPTHPTLGWFVRNGWYRSAYYVTVRRNTAIALGSLGCIDSTDPTQGCVRFNDSSLYNIRALLVLAGRSLSTPPAARPGGVLADYVEYQNCDLSGGACNPQTLFEQRPMRVSRASIPALNAPFNDRVILVDWNGTLNATQVVSSSPLRTVTLP